MDFGRAIWQGPHWKSGLGNRLRAYSPISSYHLLELVEDALGQFRVADGDVLNVVGHVDEVAYQCSNGNSTGLISIDSAA